MLLGAHHGICVINVSGLGRMRGMNFYHLKKPPMKDIHCERLILGDRRYWGGFFEGNTFPLFRLHHIICRVSTNSKILQLTYIMTIVQVATESLKLRQLGMLCASIL